MVIRVVKFSSRGTKLKRFLHLNQQTQGKLLNFVNWCSGKLSKIAAPKIGHHFIDKVILKLILSKNVLLNWYPSMKNKIELIIGIHTMNLKQPQRTSQAKLFLVLFIRLKTRQPVLPYKVNTIIQFRQINTEGSRLMRLLGPGKSCIAKNRALQIFVGKVQALNNQFPQGLQAKPL